MTRAKPYFLVGIGGSGMLPLASILRGQGHAVAGSDRALDQGRTAKKFEWLLAQGIALFPQDGSGVTSADQRVVASAAVEESVPDIVAANRLGCERMTRAKLLAGLFNAAGMGIGVAGTSGKSTVTGMIAWILHEAGLDPTVMNGAVMKNFVAEDAPFASALVGNGDAFVTEVDESDGSIALYRPMIAVINNISLDHKSLTELRSLFADFASKAQTVVLNYDDEECRILAAALPQPTDVIYSLEKDSVDLFGFDIVEAPQSVAFKVRKYGSKSPTAVELQVPGRHNVYNALAALAAVTAYAVDLESAAKALADFTGLRRRFETVGTAHGVTVIDDFAHNPDKIAATLKTLHAFPGRLLIFFQPHGYGPLRTMGEALVEGFADNMVAEDRLILCDPAYFGGTTDRSVGSEAIVEGVVARGRTAEHIADREDCGARLAALAREGDRMIVMGARDDSLTTFAEGVLAKVEENGDAIPISS